MNNIPPEYGIWITYPLHRWSNRKCPQKNQGTSNIIFFVKPERVNDYLNYLVESFEITSHCRISRELLVAPNARSCCVRTISIRTWKITRTIWNLLNAPVKNAQSYFLRIIWLTISALNIKPIQTRIYAGKSIVEKLSCQGMDWAWT